jgi:hypothetical protein
MQASAPLVDLLRADASKLLCALCRDNRFAFGNRFPAAKPIRCGPMWLDCISIRDIAQMSKCWRDAGGVEKSAFAVFSPTHFDIAQMSKCWRDPGGDAKSASAVFASSHLGGDE